MLSEGAETYVIAHAIVTSQIRTTPGLPGRTFVDIYERRNINELFNIKSHNHFSLIISDNV